MLRGLTPSFFIDWRKTLSFIIACKNAKFNNITTIIFDKDGTLENSLEYWREVGTERARLIDAQIPGVGEPLMMAFGILDNTLNPQSLMAVGSRQENVIAAAAYIAETGRSWHESRKIAESAFAEVAESKYLTKTAKSSPLFADVEECLKSLSGKGLKIGILSVDSTEAIREFVDNHQLQDYIQLCMGSDEMISKPDPRFFWQACESLGVSPEETLMVGDSLGDMNMAKRGRAAGAVGICRYQNLLLKSADIQIDTLLEIQAL